MSAFAVDLDAVLGDTRPLWDAWLEDAHRRYRTIAELDPSSLPSDRGDAAVVLDDWAAHGIGDCCKEKHAGRSADEASHGHDASGARHAPEPPRQTGNDRSGNQATDSTEQQGQP